MTGHAQEAERPEGPPRGAPAQADLGPAAWMLPCRQVTVKIVFCQESWAGAQVGRERAEGTGHVGSTGEPGEDQGEQTHLLKRTRPSAKPSSDPDFPSTPAQEIESFGDKQKQGYGESEQDSPKNHLLKSGTT